MGKYDAVWRHYRMAKEGQSTTIRSGYGAYGIYPFDPTKPFDFTRSESDAEHVFGTLILAFQLRSFFPEMMTEKIYLRVMECLLMHELGENVGGDIMDDGTRDDAKKDWEEFQYLKAYLEEHPSTHGVRILNDFRNMQQKVSDIGLITYFCDKTEAILQNLIYEAQGRCGDFNTKRKMVEKTSERDEQELLATNSTKPADMWAYGFYDMYKDRPYFDIFFQIIRAGVRDVRGEDFQWL